MVLLDLPNETMDGVVETTRVTMVFLYSNPTTGFGVRLELNPTLRVRDPESRPTRQSKNPLGLFQRRNGSQRERTFYFPG